MNPTTEDRATPRTQADPHPIQAEHKTLRQLMDQMAGLLEQHNLKLAAIGTGAGWVKHKLSLTDGNENQRTKAIAYVKGVIDLAARYDAPAIIGSMQGRSGEGVSHQGAILHLKHGLFWKKSVVMGASFSFLSARATCWGLRPSDWKWRLGMVRCQLGLPLAVDPTTSPSSVKARPQVLLEVFCTTSKPSSSS